LLARRTRQRKKVENEALRDQFITLLLENEKLRHAVKEKIDPSIADPLVSKPFELPDNVKDFLKSIVNAHQKALWNEITSKQRSYCIVDPHNEDHPILHVSRGFCDLTGYSPQEAVGRNCRFLQGSKTDPVVSKLIGDHLRNKQDIVATLLNYRKNGDMFWNKLEIHHCFDEDNHVKFIVGVQTEVSQFAWHYTLF
jgi:PAS domain S-box-containing protein